MGLNLKEIFKEKNDIETIKALNTIMQNFSDSLEDEEYFELLEKEYFTTKHSFLEPYLSFFYFHKNDYHLSYYFSSGKKDNNNICSLYYSLSLFYLGYNHICLNQDYVLNIKNVFLDTSLLLRDRLLLGFLSHNFIEYSTDEMNEETQKIYTYSNLQFFLDNNKKIPSFETMLCEYAESEDDLFLQARLYILLGHHFDMKYYSRISDDILQRNIEKCVYEDEYVNINFDPVKYSTFFKLQNIDIKHNFYEDDFFEVHSYDDSIGNNCFAIKTKNGTIIIDAGAAIYDNKQSKINFEAFFKDAKIDKNDIKLVVFTHAHLDHVGNANGLLAILNKETPVYLTRNTMELSNMVNKIQFATYDNTYLAQTGKKYFILDGNFEFEFFNNGHILGSVSVVFRINNKTIFFTSDYCTHDQLSIPGMNLDAIKEKYPHIDYLITESTYGTKKDLIDYNDNCVVFNKLVDLLIKYDYKIFLPAFAIGRSQELLLQLKNKPLNIHVLGLAYEVCKYYQLSTNIKIIGPGINAVLNDSNLSDIINLNQVIIASSGMLAVNSFAEKCYHELIDRPDKVALIKTGYMEAKSIGEFMLDDWKNSDKLFFDVSLSAHASYYELVSTIDYLKPSKVITVHGDGINV